MPPSLFKDLGKVPKDLLSKDYPDNFEVTLETKTAQPVACTDKIKLTRAADGQVSASVNPKWALSNGVTLSATVFTSKKLELELSKANLGVQGLKSTLKLGAKSFEALGSQKDAQSVSAEFEYLHERFAAALAVDVIAAKPQVALGVTGAYEQFTLGVEAKYSIGAATDLAALAAAVHYDGDNWSATVQRTAADGARANVAWITRLHQRIDDRLAVAAELAYAAADAGNDKAGAPSVAIGGQFKGDGADFKAKASTNGNIAFSYAQSLNYFTRATLGLGLSPVDFSNNKFGLALTFSE